MSRRRSYGWIAGCAMAVAFAAACDRNGPSQANNNANPNTGATAAADQSSAKKADLPIEVTGCLQRGPGMNEFILSNTDRASGPVGTSGAGNDPIGERQMRAAARSYRLSGDSDQLKGLIGKQVRVSGTLADRSRLPKVEERRNDEAKGASGADDRDRAKIDDDDLAKVDVKTIDTVSDACRPAATSSGAAKRKGAK